MREFRIPSSTKEALDTFTSDDSIEWSTQIKKLDLWMLTGLHLHCYILCYQRDNLV
jgi:hypothetical protein